MSKRKGDFRSKIDSILADDPAAAGSAGSTGLDRMFGADDGGKARDGRSAATLDRMVAPTTETKLDEIDISKIKLPRGRRTDADSELRDSVGRSGILQPLLLRSSGSGFEVLDGGRRLAVARDAGLKTVPAVVRTISDKEARAMSAERQATPATVAAKAPAAKASKAAATTPRVGTTEKAAAAKAVAAAGTAAAAAPTVAAAAPAAAAGAAVGAAGAIKPTRAPGRPATRPATGRRPAAGAKAAPARKVAAARPAATTKAATNTKPAATTKAAATTKPAASTKPAAPTSASARKAAPAKTGSTIQRGRKASPAAARAGGLAAEIASTPVAAAASRSADDTAVLMPPRPSEAEDTVVLQPVPPPRPFSTPASAPPPPRPAVSPGTTSFPRAEPPARPQVAAASATTSPGRAAVAEAPSRSREWLSSLFMAITLFALVWAIVSLVFGHMDLVLESAAAVVVGLALFGAVYMSGRKA